MRTFFLVLLGLLIAMPCWAAKVYLNSGSSVEGNVKETTADSIKIDVGGVPVTYYKDEISRIEGDADAARALGLPAEAPALSQPAATQEPVASAPAVVADAAATVSAAKKDLILKFIDVFGTRQAMIANFNQMMSQLPTDQSDKLRKVFSVDAIIQELIPVYDKHFSEAELTTFINFYSSAEGVKLVSSIPQIMKESVDVSARYFEANMPEELKTLPAPQEK